MSDWRSRCEAKRAERDARIPADFRLPAEVLARWNNASSAADFFDKEPGILTAEERTMTDATATEALEKLRTGKWTSEALTRATCKRAAIAQQLLNCLTELFFDEAIERAKQLDAEFKRTGKPVGRLHGLPMSIKDLFFWPGLDATKGLVAYISMPVPKDAPLPVPVKGFWDAGAVFYCKTQVPQSMMTFESGNAVFGRAANPWNRALTPGGSSGGEGALVAFRGSPLGIGTDIGGSVRIPAFFSGVYGLKTSAGRVSRKQVPHNGPGMGVVGGSGMTGVQGPLARSIEDLELYMEVEVAAEEWKHDADIVPIPWTPVTLPPKLKLGFFTSNGFTNPPPPMRRVLDKALDALRAAGHELVPFPTPHVAEMVGLWYCTCTGDGLVNLRSTIEQGGEGFDVSISPFVDWGVGQGFLGKKVTEWGAEDEAVRTVRRYERGALTVAELAGLVAERDKIKNIYNDQFTALGIDAVICPPFGIPAIPHETAQKVFGVIAYTAMFNVLEWAAGNVPHGHVDPVVEGKHEGPYLNSFDREVGELFDPEVFKGAPLGVQVATRRWQEERCLAVMKVVDAALNGK
ncbi:amidase signature domain-containing protein [Hyaloraphidium curvatum]|nr:amidase signature domain-containing protein [Hyaloraphidium curvatum]